MKKIAKMLFVAALVMLAAGCNEDISSEESDIIEIKMHHDFADRLYLVYVHGEEINELEMDKVSQGVYRIYMDIPQQETILFNISAVSDEYPDAVVWAGKLSGVDAVQLSINHTNITHEYIIKTDSYPSAAFSIRCEDGSVNFGGGEQINFDLRIPPELPHFSEYCRLHLPPEGFSTVLPWLQTLQLYGEHEDSIVEIDYTRIYAHLPTGDVLLYEDTYDEENDYKGFPHGGLYLRYPLLYDESRSNWSMPAKTENGSLLILPNVNADKVYHWWLSSRCTVPDDAEYVRLEARVKITGPACVQAGIDFWKDENAPYKGLDINNTEAGTSDIFFDDGSGDWQIINYSTKVISIQEY